MKIPSITEKDIITWLGNKELNKGKAYAKDGAVRYMRTQDMTLKAECWGASPNPYRLSITFNKNGPETGFCSCPVGSNAKCKHAAALLYNWVHFPESFKSIESIAKILESNSKEGLIAIIRQMLDKHPDLEILFEARDASEQSLTPALVERQVEKMLDSLAYEWRYNDYDEYADPQVFQPFQQLLKKAEENLKSGNSNDASVVFQVLSVKLMQNHQQYVNEDDPLGGIINDCATGLGKCLATLENSEQRMSFVRTMFDIYDWDIKEGGYGIGDDIPELISANANESEKSLVATLLNDAIEKVSGDSWSQNFRKRAYGGFLLELSSKADDESYLQMCRKSGRHLDATQRLLELKQIDDAVKEAKLLSNSELVNIADFFVEQGYTEQIYELVLASSKLDKKEEPLKWLCDYHKECKEYSQALEFQEKIFWSRYYLSLSGYLEIEAIAQKTDNWLATKKQIITKLQKKEEYELLTEIYLHDQRIDKALQALKQTFIKSRLPNERLAIKVARAAEETHPKEALEYYAKFANKIIKDRDRSEYAKSVNYILSIRNLYKKLNQEGDWEKYLLEVKQETKQMRAFKAELQKAKL